MHHETKVDPNTSFVLELSPDQFVLSVFNIQAQSYIKKIIDTLDKSIASTDNAEAKVISYIWSLEAKDVAILIRDCKLNLLRLKYYEKEGIKSEEDSERYKLRVSNRIFDATSALNQTFKKIKSGEVAVDVKWLHELNPAPVVIEQLQTIVDQIKKIERSQHKLDNITVSFASFKKSYKDNMQVRTQRSSELQSVLIGLDESIKEITGQTNKDSIRKKIELLDAQVVALENQTNMSDYEFIALDDIDKLTVPVATDGGKLQYKQIDILSEVSSWTTFNLSGPLREIDNRLLNFKEKVTVTLMQLSNRLKAKIDISESDEIQFDTFEMCKPLQKLLVDYTKIIVPEIHDRIDGLQNSLDNLINVNKLFDEKNLFLPVSRISQLSSGLTFKDTIQKRYKIDKLIANFHQLTNGIFTREKIKEKPTAASYISSVLSFDAGSDQTALFMRKGFLGSSFHIERPIKESAMKKHFELWKAGFGGSLLITGSHLSGKSSMLELITIQQPEIKNYNVVINQSLDVNGHKINVRTDLIKALKEVVKYVEDEQCIIAIDNLEQYVSDANSMFDFFNALQNIIIKHAQKIYFAIVIEERQFNRLSSYFKMDNVFSETINADEMSSSLIEDALQVRALAVANHDEVTFNSDKLRQKAKKIANQTQGNIGLAMQLWCSYDEIKSNNVSAIGFNNKVKSHKTLLGYLLSFEHLSISKLKMFFDDEEFKKMSADIEHLCQQKILVRKNEGNIQIQPFLRPQIHQILSQIKLN